MWKSSVFGLSDVESRYLGELLRRSMQGGKRDVVGEREKDYGGRERGLLLQCGCSGLDRGIQRCMEQAPETGFPTQAHEKWIARERKKGERQWATGCFKMNQSSTRLCLVGVRAGQKKVESRVTPAFLEAEAQGVQSGAMPAEAEQGNAQPHAGIDGWFRVVCQQPAQCLLGFFIAALLERRLTHE